MRTSLVRAVVLCLAFLGSQRCFGFTDERNLSELTDYKQLLCWLLILF